MTSVCLPTLKVSHLGSLVKEKDQLIDEKCDMLLKQKEELSQLNQGKTKRVFSIPDSVI